MELQNLRDLFVEELADLYSAETQLVEAIPLMAQAASSTELRNSFQTHLGQTQNQINRLEQIFSQLGVSPSNKTCKGMRGIISEAQETIKENGNPNVKDAALIAQAQRVEHYEIAGYGSVRTYAQQLGENRAAELLQQTLNEEAETDKKLTQLAVEIVNAKAGS